MFGKLHNCHPTDCSSIRAPYVPWKPESGFIISDYVCKKLHPPWDFGVTLLPIASARVVVITTVSIEKIAPTWLRKCKLKPPHDSMADRYHLQGLQSEWQRSHAHSDDRDNVKSSQVRLIPFAPTSYRERRERERESPCLDI